jgi:hypothetical protein
MTIRSRIDAVRTLLADRRRFAEICDERREPCAIDPRAAALAAEIEKKSYVILPDYYTVGQVVEMREELDRVFRRYPAFVKPDKFDSDHRLFGAEHGSSAIAKFHTDPLFHAVGEAYFRGRMANAATLAARLDAKPGNLGSGQGWHRDSLQFQYKSFVYLSDVSPENGPFQILSGSHKPAWQIHDTFRFGLDPTNSRLADEIAEKIVASRPFLLKTLTAKAGTVVLINTSAIHRGSPIANGRRYSLFNYFYPKFWVDDDFLQKFAPLLTADAAADARAAG